MGKKDITMFCYWNGNTIQGSEGLSYDKPPNKAIKVKSGMNYKAILNKMYSVASLDRRQFKIKMTCRYPSVVGKILKYIPVPIKDDDDVDIMFDAIVKHSELSNIDLYLDFENISSDIMEVLVIKVTVLILKDLLVKSKGIVQIYINEYNYLY